VKRFVFYHKSTGVLHPQAMQFDVSDLPAYLKRNTPTDHIALEHATAQPGDSRFDLETKQILKAPEAEAARAVHGMPVDPSVQPGSGGDDPAK